MRYKTFSKQSTATKNRLTKINAFVQSQVDITKTQPLTNSNAQRLRNFQNECNTLYKDFKKAWDTLLADEVSDDYNEAEAEQFFDSISDLHNIIESEVTVLLPPKEDLVQQQVLQSNPPTQSLNLAPVLRLPKFDLPKFTGNYESWISFYNIFQTSVHNNDTLPPVNKFQYLLSSLSGEPLDIVKSLTITSENYDIALKLLKDRYDNKRRIVTQHVTKVLDLPLIVNGSLKSMRSFLTIYNENTQALKSLDHDITNENTLLVLTLLKKLSPELRKTFEDSRETNNELPLVNDLIRFIETEYKRLEGANIGLTSQAKLSYTGTHTHKSTSPACSNSFTPKSRIFPHSNSPTNKAAFVTTNPQMQCKFCLNSDHTIYQCLAFQALDFKDRKDFVMKNKFCFNCLGCFHDAATCNSIKCCQICSKRHHTLLHNYTTRSSNFKTSLPINAQTQNENLCRSVDSKNPLVGISNQSRLKSTPTTILLATCLVKVFNNEGQYVVLRAVLDSAAQLTLISEKAAQLLCLPRTRLHEEIQGVSGSVVNSKGIVKVHISSLNGTNLAAHHPCMVLNKISSILPQVSVTAEVRDKLKGFVLADPCFDKPAEIDLLIGADLFALTLTGENYALGDSLPHALGTMFGYVIMGSAPVTLTANSTHPVSLLSTCDLDLHNSLQKFWTIEEPPSFHKPLTEEEQYCLKHFEDSHKRDETGRYIVSLPKRNDATTLGESYHSAKCRIYAMEKKFNVDPVFKSHYDNFMKDYIDSGHMSVCENPKFEEKCYLPHHGVYKQNPPNSKIRVVFDGSSKTSSGISLNDWLLPGPKLQNDISDVLLHFRCHKIVFTCDIRQMYRQILISEDDKKYQLILWRFRSDQPLKTYALQTVTYGLNCSPFLAIRTLHQLAHDEGHSFPKASEVLIKSIFYDDIVTGANDIQQAQSLQKELTELLLKGGFELRKWISNTPELLINIPEDHRETPIKLDNNSEAVFSVLGLKYIPETDMFSYDVNILESSLTKRGVLSTIAKLYDLPGFLTPVTFWAKSFIQYLWTLGLAWDEVLPNDVKNKWTLFLEELPKLQCVMIPRYVSIVPGTNMKVELHGFSDASEKGYAAVVYLRVPTSDDKATVKLLISKSRVAPLKKITLPRLELCGAHLLGKLLNYSLTQLSFHVHVEKMYAWTDSSIVLTWIRTPPYKLKTFVTNRVAELQELVPPHNWNHISTKENPADCASRGLLPSEFVSYSVWFDGPLWLSKKSLYWPKSKFTLETSPETLEMKSNPLNVLVNAKPKEEFSLLTKFSSFSKLVNVTAYVLRFIKNVRSQLKVTGSLNNIEVSSAKKIVFKLVQHVCFKDDYDSLKKGSECSTKLQRLSPFVDQEDIIRVGGRLKHSDLTQDAKFPIILPKSHYVTKLLIMHFHLKYLHAGPQLLQSILTQEVWIISARSLIRSVVYKCIRCFKLRPHNKPPLMGDLPKTRLNPVRPFYHTGMDYSGHIETKIHTNRNSKHVKSYLCLFVCFVTKAVHLEIVTDLSVESFIAALTRFVSRRGLCAHLYSDCGTNFTGASKVLNQTFQTFLKESKTQQSLEGFAQKHSINFHFQPPAAPHQGGLWESAIKSAKYHLKRVIGEQVLTIMELNTLVTQVEAILNSRPLTALSSDPSDISALTPGHFLIGTSLVAVPELNVENVQLNRLNRWQTVQAFHQRFWRRWHQEYLHQLQERTKWYKRNKNLEVGDLVLIQDSRTAPLLWPLGRIIETFQGLDGVVRVVTVQTQRGVFKRPAIKVYLLPITDLHNA